MSVDFYFDFSSPYAYLAAMKMDDIAMWHGREVTWRPILLGPIMERTGAGTVFDKPLKGIYLKRDVARTARLFGLPEVRYPEPFPFAALAACRAFYWLEAKDPNMAVSLAQRLFREAYGEGRPIASGEDVAKVAERMYVDSHELLAAIETPAIKARLKAEVDKALQAGVVGVPFVIAEGEPFWGADKLEQISRWLDTGGW
ncbi:MAG: 2-hydroxychromene-2-carboxylate isomerase [Alphaproteobacteria bacterium]